MIRAALLACFLLFSNLAFAQMPEGVASDQQALLASPDPVLAGNKRLVYDFWREVLQGCHLDIAARYLTQSYIQHNPTVPTGREGFVRFFSKLCKPKPVAGKIEAPLISIVAERDLVVLVFANKKIDEKDPENTYTTTWFDMFRVTDGKISEHWDPAIKQ